MTRCPNAMFGRHQFEPRYDTTMPDDIEGFEGTLRAMESLKDKIYVRDVCVRCGQTIERTKP